MKSNVKTKVKDKYQKGGHYSPETEFKSGQPSPNRLPVGTITIRTQKEDGNRRWIKVAEPDVWILYAKYVWIQHNGPIPKGHVIHHKDEDQMHDVIENLQCVTKKEHFDIHNIGEMGRAAIQVKVGKL
jgi:hypothetical protein